MVPCGSKGTTSTAAAVGLMVGLDLSFRNPVRRIRMPSPLPLVDTHPLEDCFFPVTTATLVDYSLSSGCLAATAALLARDHHVAATWGVVSRRAQVQTRRKASTHQMAGIIHPLTRG